MVTENELLGTRALARALGVSPSAVTKAVKEGRLTPATNDGRPMFDLEAARVEWQPNVSPTATVPDDDDDEATDDDNARYRKARADKEESLAAQEALELARMRRDLLPHGEVALAFTQLLRVANQAFSGLPAKLLSRYPGLTADGRDFLVDEMRSILDGLAEWEVNI